MQVTKRSLQNGLVFVSDIDGGESVWPVTGASVEATASCVNARCRHEVDVEAELTLGASDEVATEEEPAFDGFIETPNKQLMTSDVLAEPVLTAEVPGRTMRVRIWLNHPEPADKLVVGWG